MNLKEIGNRPLKRFDWEAFSLLLLIWLPAGGAGIYAKWAMLRADGYLKTAISLGRPAAWMAGLGASQFTLAEKISFFRMDLLVSIVAVPLCLLLFSMWKQPRLTGWLVAALSIAGIAAVNIQLEAYWLIGRFQSWELIKDALEWGLRDVQQARSYMVGIAVFRLVSLIIAVLAAAILLSFRSKLPAAWHRVIVVGCISVWILLLAVTAVSWLPRMPSTISHSSFQLASVSALMDAAPGTSLASLPLSELKAQYRRISGAPEDKAKPEYWGAAPDYDVLFFVIETMPSRCVAFDTSLDDLPHLGELREHAWIGAHHYSTYPVTSRAVFSLLTSLYPPESTRNWVRLREHVNSGLVRNLSGAGYESAVYGSSASISPAGKDIFENLGFKKVQATEEAPGSNPGSKSVTFFDREYVMYQRTLDLLALEEMKRDMTGWIKKNQRYVAVYLPQISHAPWGDILTHGQEPNLLKRCRGLMEVQDQWLGDVVELLKKTGRLDRTLIVVTGDHGIRTSVEDPALPVRTTDEYSFAVPFMLYAPGVLNSTQTIPWVTSHIDVEPSILDLLGVKRNKDAEQGAAVWNAAIQQRTTFFLANLLHGSDGYYSAGKFYSWNRSLDVTYQNDRLHFEPQDMISRASPLQKKVRDEIQALDEVRAAWMTSTDHVENRR
ncbi:MAG: sulfatase-like hydrolase/transferase [Bryobacteraceae bacterium]